LQILKEAFREVFFSIRSDVIQK